MERKARTNRAVLVEQSGLEHAETALERAEELVVGEPAQQHGSTLPTRRGARQPQQRVSL